MHPVLARNRNRAALAMALLAHPIAGAAAPSAALPAAQPNGQIHRAVGVLNYIIGDYPLAVGDGGEILDDTEYREQIALLERVQATLTSSESNPDASSLSPALLRDLAELRELVDEHGGSGVVVAVGRRVRDALIAAYDLQLAPEKLPSLASGRALYAIACAACHGAVGRARTPLAGQLDPRPTDLLSRHLDQTLSPYQTFNIVTYGVEGTSMPAFVALSPEERWDIAFYVMAMRQRAVPRSRQQPVDPPLDVLARSTDAELGQWLAEHGVPAAGRAAEVARLRRARLLDSD